MFQVIGGIASIVGTFTGAVEGDHHQQDTTHTQVKQSSIPVEETKQQCDDSQHVEEWKGADCTVVVKDLMVFPCRGAQGIHLKEANILESGVEYDRHWFVLEKEFDINTDPNVDKRFVSLTKSELLGLVTCRFDQRNGSKHLVFSHPKKDQDLWIDMDNPTKDEEYTLYNNLMELVTSYSEGNDANEWFTTAIGRDVVLARCSEQFTSDTYKKDYNYLFQNGDKRNAGHLKGALHIVTQKSIQDLQTRIDEKVCKVTAEQFRPNIVVDGVEPWEEDSLRQFKLANTDNTFRVIYNSKRCKIANYEISKEKRNDMGEPLNTLNQLKHLKGVGPIFGCFVQPDKKCVIKVGDKIKYTHKYTGPMNFE